MYSKGKTVDGQYPEKNEEKAGEKVKLPKQNKGISPEAIRMIEMI